MLARCRSGRDLEGLSLRRTRLVCGIISMNTIAVE